ncbi:MAG TPA: glycosyltransferase family 2 protein [Vicinamibacterales bacterium]|nr:glycosyltransferase family 2 protein [Vicinamibacterales bacterium]
MSVPGPGATPRLVSIVVPVYGEAMNLPLLVDALDRVTAGRHRWEYLFVNDGSPDNSLEVLHRLAAVNPRIRILDLSRNFGKEAALSAGLAHAAGDAVICMDADLQHPPALIPTFLDHWEHGAEVVVTVREDTHEPSLVRRAGSAIFYWLLTRMSDVEVVGKSTDYRLLDRRVVEAFLQLADHDRLVRGLVDWLGFRRVSVPFAAPARVHGASSFSYRRLTALFFNGIMTHSSAPLRWVGLLGLFITISATALLAFVLFDGWLKLVYGVYTPQAKLIIGITILQGIVLTALGVVSVYVARIYTEVVRRPLYVVREEHPKKETQQLT